jgi:hypothetical protein
VNPTPEDAAGIEAEGIVEVEMVVDQGREQVVGAGRGVEVAGEMEVDPLHRNDLATTAAGGPALHPEGGAERRLAEREAGGRRLRLALA